jgi:hypothetical protein
VAASSAPPSASWSRQAFEATFCPPWPHSFGRPRALVLLPARNPPGTDSNPSPLGPQPLPGRPGPERGAPPGPPRGRQKTRDLVFRALTEVTAGGSSAPISWWDGANRQAAPGRPHRGGRILSTAMHLFAVERHWPLRERPAEAPVRRVRHRLLPPRPAEAPVERVRHRPLRSRSAEAPVRRARHRLRTDGLPLPPQSVEAPVRRVRHRHPNNHVYTHPS